MKLGHTLLLIFPILLCINFQQTNAFKIFGIFPVLSKSHYSISHSLMKGLADAGHEVTVLTPISAGKKINNYNEIFLDGMEEAILNSSARVMITNVIETWTKIDKFELFNIQLDLSQMLSNFVLDHPKTQAFIKNPTEQFDLIVMEIALDESMLGFAHTLKAPVIGFSSFGSSKMTNDLVGSPAPLSYVPSPFLGLTDHMTFMERVLNVVYSTVEKVHFDYLYINSQKDIYDRVFPDPKPDLEDLRKNVSFVLLNTHFTLNFPKPYVPNMIEVGGMQINRKVNPLPADIKEFIENASHGVIYFSMGSNIKGIHLPAEIRQSILKIFSGLKQRVLWKWEDPDLPGKPDNVFISKWFPQDDILAHPNVRLFITHGGLLSTTEAIYHGVPLIGLPLYGDQELNMAVAVKNGFGISLPFKDLTGEKLEQALKQMLSTDSYSQNVKIISERYRDQPMTPLETAIFWVEYVARHKGAPHLRSGAQDLSFIQYHSLDIYGFLIGIIFGLIFTLKCLITAICCRKSKKKSIKIKLN